MEKSFEQNEGGSKENKAQKSLSEFVVTSGNAPELLDFLPEAFDEIFPTEFFISRNRAAYFYRARC